MMSFSGYSRTLDQFSLLMLFLSAAFLTFSTAGLEVASYLALLGFLIGGNYAQKWQFIKSSPFILSALALYLILWVGCLYSSAIPHEIVRNLKAYEKLLFIPASLWALYQFPKMQRPFLSLLLVGILINFVLGFVKVHHLWPGTQNDLLHGTPSASFGSLKGSGHIALSYFASMVTFTLGVIFIHQFRTLSLLQKVGLGLGSLFSLYYLLALTDGRSGLITFLVLMLYLFARMIGNFKAYKTGILALMLTILLLGLAYHYSPVLKASVARGTANLQQYQEGNADSSWGARLGFWKNSLTLIQNHPIFGYGTGGFYAPYMALKPSTDKFFPGTDNPHNQYLFLMVENGTPGLLCFLALIYFAQRNRVVLNDSTTPRQNETLKLVLEASTFAFAIGCLYNSWLHDVHEGFFILMFWVGLRALIKERYCGNT